MEIRSDFVDAVGNTPLIKLRKASELTGCTILGKAEFLNPGSSVKDRAAKYMVLDSERRGVIERGGLIVEGTAGNTGIGLALVGNSRGYRTLILMPNTQSQEKKDALRVCGGAEARDHLDAHREVAVTLAERVPVLLRKDRRRREHHDLLVVHRRGEGCANRDLGLAEADVAADEPIHRTRRLEILLDLLDRALLIGRLPVRERRFELLEPLVSEVVRIARRLLPRTNSGYFR